MFILNRYGLLGPSGCGKTTLLSCIIGRSRLDAGHIQVSVRNIKDIGYMPQVIITSIIFNQNNNNNKIETNVLWMQVQVH